MVATSADYHLFNRLVDADRLLLEAAEDELRARQLHYQKIQQYYDGDHPRPLKPAQGKIDNNVIVNLVEEVVDATQHFLTSNKMPDITTDDDKERSPEEEYIDQTWEFNDGMLFIVEQVTCGATGGHNFVKVEAPDEDYPLPRFTSLDGANTLVFWQADDRRIVKWYSTYWTVGQKNYRQDTVNLAALDGTPEWEIYEFVKASNEKDWSLRLDIPVNPVRWPYALGPIVDWPHLPNGRRYYGKSEFGNRLELLGLNDMVNKAASDYKAITRVHAAPRTIATGTRVEEMNKVAGIDNFWAIPAADAKVYNIEMMTDLAALMNLISFGENKFHSISRTVILSGGPDAFRNVTNLGIKAAYMGQMGKNGILEHTYGKGISELSRRALMLGGYGEDIRPKVKFHTALPLSDIEIATTSQLRVDMGIESLESASADNGLNFDQEQKRRANEEALRAELKPQPAPNNFNGNQNGRATNNA